jgi:hypothetical protein
MEYDENGNEILEIFYKDGEEDTRYTYEYDQNGNKIKGTCTDEDGTTVTTYEYNTDNNLIHEIEYDEDGQVVSEDTYDSYGNWTSSKYNGEYFSSDRTYENEYDDNGNLVKCTEYNLGEIYDYIVYTYDSNNNCILEETYEPESDTPYEITESEYDSEGNQLREVRTYNGSIDKLEEYAYDSNGNTTMIKVESYDYDGNIEDWSYHYEYEYDSDGNEISKISYNPDGTIDRVEKYEYMAIEEPVK